MTSYGNLVKQPLTPPIYNFSTFLFPVLRSTPRVVTAMLPACLRLLLLLPLVRCIPSPSRPPSRLCRRCCDHQESPAATAQYQMPEVRAVINMTILKGILAPGLASVRVSPTWSWLVLPGWFPQFSVSSLCSGSCRMQHKKSVFDYLCVSLTTRF